MQNARPPFGRRPELQIVNFRRLVICILQFAICILQFLPQNTAAAPPAGEVPNAITEPGRVVYEISRLREFDDERLPIALTAAGAIALVACVAPALRATHVDPVTVLTEP